MRINRWFLDPLYALPTFFILQFMVWLFVMEESPTLPGAAPKYYTDTAMFRYVLLLAAMITGVFLGKVSLRNPQKGFAKVASGHWIQKRARSYLRLGLIAMFLSVLGEATYVRVLLQEPTLLHEAIAAGYLPSIQAVAREQSIVGLVSLANAFLVAVAVFALLAFHPETEPAVQTKARRWLGGVGVFTVIHALLMSERMYFFYYISIVLAARLLLKGRQVKVLRVLFVVVSAVLIAWVGETLRMGLNYAVKQGLPLPSVDVQSRVWRIIIQGYLASDLNNAFVLLDHEPSMGLLSTTAFRKLAQFPSYSEVPGWFSAFGTVNVLGLWWWDAGWFALPIAFTTGIWLGSLYRLARRGCLRLSLGSLYYLVSYPGIFALLRINYYALTPFLVPFGVLVIYSIMVGFVRPALVGQRCAVQRWNSDGQS